MTGRFLEGDAIYLRALSREDLNERYLGWLNDPEVTAFMETGIFPSTSQDLQAFYESVTASNDQVAFAIVDRGSDLHIGNVKLGPISWIHRKATLGILVGDKSFWGKGICYEATKLTVDYAFSRLNLRRVELGVYARHAQAIRCYEKVGFKVEGTFRSDLWHRGRYEDRLWMGVLRSEYEPAVSEGR